MQRRRRRVQFLSWLGGGCLFAITADCNGFFVSPVLTAVAVGPQASIQQGTSVQMSAVGSYNDESQNSLSSGVLAALRRT